MTAIDALVGHPLDPFFGFVWLDASRFDESVHALRDDGFAAPASSRELISALRSDPPGVIVRAAALLTDDDVELVIRAALTGHVTVVCGTTPALELALDRVQGLPIFDRR
ncbi:MAG TPA: hypothetical protein VIU61_26115 [Kofleriaceae bacterium]